jgi:hypothetical protein
MALFVRSGYLGTQLALVTSSNCLSMKRLMVETPNGFGLQTEQPYKTPNGVR